MRLFTGGTLPGSFAVSAQEALRVPAVANAVRVISEACATLDIRVVRTEGGHPVDAPDHPVAKLLHGDVNEWTSGFELVRDLVAAALTADTGGLAWINRVNGEVREIVRYSTSLSAQLDTDTGEPVYTLGSRRLAASDVIHLRGLFANCPLTLAREAIGIAKIMEDRAGKLFQNAARPGGVIEFPEHMDEEAFARMKKSWQDAHGSPEGSGKTAILYNGGKFNQLEFKSTDAQFLELRKFQILEIARAFNVPPSMLGDMEKSTFNNVWQKSREFLSYCIEPWLRALESALNRALFTDDERGEYRILFDRDDLSRADLQTRATAINSLRASEVLSADEARAWLDLAPRADGKGGTYENPNITVKPTVPAKREDPEEPA
ncbi:phage portal protein [Mesorhizobium sp. A623]